MDDVRGLGVPVEGHLRFDGRGDKAAVFIAFLHELGVGIDLSGIVHVARLHIEEAQHLVVVERLVAGGVERGHGVFGAFSDVDRDVHPFAGVVVREIHLRNVGLETPIVLVFRQDVLEVGFQRGLLVFSAEEPPGAVGLDEFLQLAAGKHGVSVKRDLANARLPAFLDRAGDVDPAGAGLFDDEIHLGVREPFAFVQVEHALPFRGIALLVEGVPLVPAQRGPDVPGPDLVVADDPQLVDDALFLEEIGEHDLVRFDGGIGLDRGKIAEFVETAQVARHGARTVGAAGLGFDLRAHHLFADALEPLQTDVAEGFPRQVRGLGRRARAHRQGNGKNRIDGKTHQVITPSATVPAGSNTSLSSVSDGRTVIRVPAPNSPFNNNSDNGSSI